MRAFMLVAFGFLIAATAGAQPVSSAIFTDPPAGGVAPARMTVLRIPTHGVQVNGIIYQAAGPGPHPTLVICHGLPGNEKNLDVAQAARRAGWNSVTFNYRGSGEVQEVFDFLKTSKTPKRSWHISAIRRTPGCSASTPAAL